MALTLRALDDLAGARKLYEKNLEICERTLQSEHPSTVISTWNLLRTVRELNDYDAEAYLIGKLRWLLEQDKDSLLSADHRTVRQYLLEILNPS